MRVGNFLDSVNEAMQKRGLGSPILDLEIKIEDRATGEFLSVDEVAIDAEHNELRIVINTAASERAAEPSPIYDPPLEMEL